MKLKGINRLFLSVLLGVIFVFSFSRYVFAEDNLGTWKTKAPMNVARRSGGVVTLKDKIYVLGGDIGNGCSNSVEEYDPVTDKWAAKAPMSKAREYTSAVTLNGKIYVLGGSTGNECLNLAEEYDPATDKWTTKSPMSKARDCMGVVVLNRKIYAIGGMYKNGSVSNSDFSNLVEEYDPVTDKWTTKAPMSTPRDTFCLVVLNGKIYAIGGWNGSSYLNSIEEYDPATDKWTTKSPMSTSRSGLGAMMLNGKVYAIGGASYSSNFSKVIYLNTVEEYDPVTDKWTTKAPMSISRGGTPGPMVLNGKIYVLGGYSDTGIVNLVEEYDPATDKWAIKSPMSTSRGDLGSMALNGRIYTIGGWTGNVSNTVEEYTPEGTATTSPTKLIATPSDAKINLSWNSVEGATSYNIKRSETAGGPYTQIGNVTTNTYSDTNVTNGKTYYYVVTAVTGASESANSNEASATLTSASTPTDPKQTGNRAILEIKMINGEIQEYDLSSSELNSFLTWYNDRSGGAAKAYYIMDKNYNVKPFLSRQLYIPFDKIMEYEVKSYNN